MLLPHWGYGREASVQLCSARVAGVAEFRGRSERVCLGLLGGGVSPNVVRSARGVQGFPRGLWGHCAESAGDPLC